MGFERHERKWFEQVLVAGIVVVVGFLVVSNIYFQQKAGKQKMMFYQLQILRSSVNLYKIVNKANPVALGELVSGFYRFPGEEVTRRYIETTPIDEKGRVVDPFGSPYYYDSQTGWVRSSTAGYEFW